MTHYEPTCPFCGRDPFHYVDIGVGFEAVAVTCCELGVEFYRREAAEVTLSREEFDEIGGTLFELRRQVEAANNGETAK